MDEKDLKITALKQRIGELSSDYEERIADLRVLLTSQEERINALQSQSESSSEDEDVVEGEVV